MTTDCASANNLFIDILAALAAGAWRDLHRCKESHEERIHCQDVSSVDAFLLALCTIHQGDDFHHHLSLLATHNIHAAMQLSIAGARLSLCRQRVWMGQLDQARQEAHAAIRQAMACGKQVGLNLTETQKTLLLERVHHLPAQIESQQQLALNVTLGRIPRQLLFVLGVHRSGTSALSGLLGKIGLGVPKDLMPATDENPKGYWESLGVTGENDQLLAKLGRNWRIEQPLPVGWPNHDATLEWRHRLLLALHQSFGESSFAVIKDPRFCILLQGLSSWMQDASVDFKFAILVRHPQEVIGSLLSRSRDPITKEFSLKLWINSVLESERATRTFPRIFVMADELFESPVSVESELREFIGISPPEQLEQEAACFIDAGLRHHRADQERLNQPTPNVAHHDLLESIALRIYEEIKQHRDSLRSQNLDNFYASLLETMG
jgi:hypothetical protein